MNKARRKAIEKVIDKFENVSSLLAEIKDDIDNIKEEEEEALDCIPENMQDGERAEHMQECLDALEEVSDALEEFDVEDLTSTLDICLE